MMFLKEKKRDGINLLIKVVQYSVTILGIIVIANLVFFFDGIVNADLDVRLLAVFGENDRDGIEKMTFAFTMLRNITGIVVIGLFLILVKTVSGNMEKRAENIRNLHLFGYTKIQIIFYEIAFILTDVGISSVLSMLLATVVFYVLSDVKSVGEICEIMNVNLQSINICFIAVMITILLSAIEVVFKVCLISRKVCR